MKTTVSLVILICCTIPLFAQPDSSNHLINPQVLQRPVTFRITGINQNRSERISVPGAFRLGPEEQKATAVIGNNIMRLDRNQMPAMRDISAAAKVFILPELHYAREAETNNQISYNILFIDLSPLRLSIDKELFEGGIRFMAIEPAYTSNNPPVQKTLSVPEEIVVSYGMESIPIQINQINWPPYDVYILSKNPVDSLEIKLLTISNPGGYKKYLPVEPAIILSCARNSIQGLGLQKIPVFIALKGITSYKPVSVAIQSDYGEIQPSTLTLSDNRPVPFFLRSEGVGNIKLMAIQSAYRSNNISIRAVFPWLFLILAISGGIIGGIGKRLKGKGKITLRLVLFSCIIGLLTSIAYWGVGIKLIDFSFEDRGYNEAMIFGISMIAGYFGIK